MKKDEESTVAFDAPCSHGELTSPRKEVNKKFGWCWRIIRASRASLN